MVTNTISKTSNASKINKVTILKYLANRIKKLKRPFWNGKIVKFLADELPF